ncbi:hypothetical protein SAMN02745150_00258 [Brevinema andersonii]|uniref:Uncharacterized protein n=1 Tax=Brevinema andersonii TaxID=34097 RepID=A0A1I1D8Y8_BREAD|nr:hypothetical protein [Brevinema andersonii]SFB69280.1 hypothetical protein SAMN02745150_00258 [Brevinema andersonii]
MQVKTVIISRSDSPLNSLKIFFRAHNHWLVLDETELSQLSDISAEELWIDGCVDLYRFGLENTAYFYRFFSGLHYFLESVRKKFKIVRLIRYFAYDTDFDMLRKNFSFYRTFVDYFQEAYYILPLYIPEILEYTTRPANLFQRVIFELASKNTVTIPWKKDSTFSVISVDDIFSNLADNDLAQNPISISGLSVCLGDVIQSAVVIWGGMIHFEEAYTINECHMSQMQEFNNVSYSLEDMLISMLK